MKNDTALLIISYSFIAGYWFTRIFDYIEAGNAFGSSSATFFMILMLAFAILFAIVAKKEG